MAMSSTSSPPDASNIVHGVFPTQALRVRASAKRLPDETPRGAEQASAALATSGEGDAAGPPTDEAQACFAFIVSDDDGREQGRAPSAAADALPRAAQATVGEAMATPPADGASGFQEGDGRATSDATVVLPEPPEDATFASAADVERYTLETDEAVREQGTRRTAGENFAGEDLASEAVAGEPAAHRGEPPEIDADDVDSQEIASLEIASHEIDAREIDARPVDSPELASYQLASDEVAAEEVIAAEGAFDGAAAREGAARGVAAPGITQHEGDTEMAADEEASHKGTAARPVASQIAPPQAAGTRTFPTLARASLAHTAHPGAPTHGAPRPLTRALDTAARLAADANAAAAALDSLKRLLQQELPASGQAAPAAEQRVQHRLAPLPPRPPPPPPERPIAAVPLAALQPAALPPADRARFDVRGFFAGVALSCAIGIILYLFMTAG
jgi:hypothetical protein